MQGQAIIIRVPKADSVYLYQLLEGYEGLVSHSTLPHENGAGFRDIELVCPLGREREVDELISILQAEIPLIRL
jgi:hypothetical protein